MGQALAEALHMARFRRGVGMRAVAKDTGLALSAIHRVEHGDDPRLSTVAKLAVWMRLTPYELMQIVLAEVEAN